MAHGAPSPRRQGKTNRNGFIFYEKNQVAPRVTSPYQSWATPPDAHGGAWPAFLNSRPRLTAGNGIHTRGISTQLRTSEGGRVR